MHQLESDDEVATAVKLLREIYSEEKMNIPGILDFQQNDEDLIHLANTSCEAHFLRNVVVLAVHTGKTSTVKSCFGDGLGNHLTGSPYINR